MAELPGKKPLTTCKQLNNYQAPSKKFWLAFCWGLIIWLAGNQCKPRLTIKFINKRMKTLTNFISNFVFKARN